MNIGIFIYDDAEVLDFAGPFEVFSTARRLANADWQVLLISETGGPVNARGSFPVHAHFSINEHPPLDVLIVVGGVHAAEVAKPNVIDWIRAVSMEADRVASVCTGAFLLAETGLMDGCSVTTHWEDLPALRRQYPALDVIADQRWVANGRFVTSGGIAAGIDMSLYLVSELVGESLALATSRQMEYSWEL